MFFPETFVEFFGNLLHIFAEVVVHPLHHIGNGNIFFLVEREKQVRSFLVEQFRLLSLVPAGFAQPRWFAQLFYKKLPDLGGLITVSKNQEMLAVQPGNFPVEL